MDERPGRREPGQALFGRTRCGRPGLGRAGDCVFGTSAAAVTAAVSPVAGLGACRGRADRPRAGEAVVGRAGRSAQGRRLEAASRSIGGEYADCIRTELACEVRIALGHGRAYQGSDSQAARKHCPAECNPVRDVRGQDHDVGALADQLRHQLRPLWQREVVRLPRDDVQARRTSGLRSRVRHGSGVVVLGGDDREPKRCPRRLAKAWRENTSRERRRIRAEVRAAGSHPEDHR